MHLHRRVAPLASFLLALCSLTLSTPTQQSTSFNLPNAGTDHSITTLPQTANHLIGPSIPQRLNTSLLHTGLVSPSTNRSTNIGERTVTWDINQTLSLVIDIGNWKLDPEKIVATLHAAQETIGKKQGGALLHGKFRQETGTRINTMVFEMGPALDLKLLTWADVGQVLGDEDGLPRFFKASQEWHDIYFDFCDTERGGLVGEGSVRKWYMLESGSVSGE